MVKITSLVQLFDILPEEEKIMVDVLRQIVLETLPPYCKEKLSFNVPYFYGHKGICIIWPATIPWGGVKNGVLLGYWQGNKLKDPEHYLTHGTNKKIFYKIFRHPEEIDEKPVIRLLHEAIRVDQSSKQGGMIILK